MIITINQIKYEKNEQKKIEDAILKLNEKLKAYNQKMELSLHSFEIYFRSYASLVGNKGIRDVESAFKYVTTCLYQDLASEYMVRNEIDIVAALDEAMTNKNFYSNLYKDIVTFGKNLYEELYAREASLDFVKLSTRDMDRRAARISIFDNKNGVASVYADPNGQYHNKEYDYKRVFFTSVCDDALQILDNMEQKGQDRDTYINNLYNVAFKYRTLKECQKEGWWPFKYFTKHYWKVNTRMNMILDKVKESKCEIFGNGITNNEFVRYMKKDEPVALLNNLKTTFFSDFNVAKINNVVYQAARADLEPKIDDLNRQEINVEEVNFNNKLESEKQSTKSNDLEHLELRSEEDKDLDSSKRTIRIDDLDESRSSDSELEEENSHTTSEVDEADELEEESNVSRDSIGESSL